MIYEKIKQLCDEQKITIAELERSAGIGNGTVGKWRTVTPNVENLGKVAIVLNCSISALLEEMETVRNDNPD